MTDFKIKTVIGEELPAEVARIIIRWLLDLDPHTRRNILAEIYLAGELATRRERLALKMEAQNEHE